MDWMTEIQAAHAASFKLAAPFAPTLSQMYEACGPMATRLALMPKEQAADVIRRNFRPTDSWDRMVLELYKNYAYQPESYDRVGCGPLAAWFLSCRDTADRARAALKRGSRAAGLQAVIDRTERTMLEVAASIIASGFK